MTVRTASLERNITKRVVALLDRVPSSFTRKMHGNRMQGGGIPDLYFTCAALRGRSAWIELKRPGEVRTKLQEHTGGRLDRAGCLVVVASSVEEVSAWLESNHILVRPPTQSSAFSRPTV